MSPADINYLAGLIARRLGLPITAEVFGAERLLLTPSDIHQNDGFSIEVLTGWRSIEVRFVPGAFARPLIKKMGESGLEARRAFTAIGSGIRAFGKITFKINGHEHAPLDASHWPAEWHGFEFSVRKQGVVFEEMVPGELRRLLGELVVPALGMCVALIGVDDVEVDPSAFEGNPILRESVKYERKPINREICLSVRGRRCYCCNISFGEVYGPNAEEFIEVHHITPAAGMGPGYRINPVTELVPVCSNCHSVIHLSNPARHPDEIRALLANRMDSA